MRLWVAPPTKMDAAELTKEGYYNTFGRSRCSHRNAWLLAVHG